MDARMTKLAETCLRGAETNTMTFPQIVGTLMQEGFESYAIDFRRASATYRTVTASWCRRTTEDVPIAPALDVSAVQATIREAQALAPGYSYAGFCAQVMRAGCAGYVVSLSGRRAVYFGRTAETHVELFPQDR